MKTTYNYTPVKGQPRPADTYRGARRNAARGTTWRGVKPNNTVYHPAVRPNRSKKWG